LQNSTLTASEAENFPFIVKMSSNEKKMKKQHIVFSIDEKMQILAKVDAQVGTPVDLVAMLVLSVLTLHTILSKRSEIQKSYSHRGPSFAKECKCLKTSPLEELEIIFLMWFEQALTVNVSIDAPHLKEKALHVAALEIW
jgi:hypothetical protein